MNVGNAEKRIIASILIAARVRQLKYQIKRGIRSILKKPLKSEGISNLTDFIAPREKMFLMYISLEASLADMLDRNISELFDAYFYFKKEGGPKDVSH